MKHADPNENFAPSLTFATAEVQAARVEVKKFGTEEGGSDSTSADTGGTVGNKIEVAVAKADRSHDNSREEVATENFGEELGGSFSLQAHPRLSPDSEAS